MSATHCVLVAGGGISGLTCAYYLATRFRIPTKVYLVCDNGGIGGWLRSTRRSNGNVHDNGPRSIRPVGESGKNLLHLVEELNFSNDVISVTSHNGASKNRLLLVDGRLRPLPSGIGSLLTTKPPFKHPLAWYLMKDLFGPKTKLETNDESVHDFMTRRFGPEMAEFIGDPLCRGVFAGDSRQLSAKALLKDAYQAERNHGSVIRGMILESLGVKKTQSVSSLVQKAVSERWTTWSLMGGMQTLVDGLREKLVKLGVTIHESNAVKLQPSSSKLNVVLRDGNTVEADHVFAAVPAPALSTLVEEDHKQLGKILKGIDYVTVAVINLEFKSSVIPVQAFGFLVPSSQNSKILGVVFDSCCFPQLGPSRLTVMMGGHWFNEYFGDNPRSADLLRTALGELKTYVGISEDPTWSQVLIHKDCIPQYRVGHADLVSEMRRYIDKKNLPLSLVGSPYDGISVNDCVYSARNQVEEFLKRT